MKNIKISLRGIFLKNEFPYLLTILFGMMGWSVHRIISTVSDAPTIEYKLSTNTVDGTNEYTYRLINCSGKEGFKNLKFYVSTRKTVWDSGFIAAKPPATRESIDRSCERAQCVFTIEEFQPGWQYDLKVYSRKEADPEISFTSAQSLNLVALGLRTFMVRNELGIIIGMLVLWICLILLYLRYLPNEKQQS